MLASCRAPPHLNVVVKHQVVIAVTLQQGLRVRHVEVLELQDGVGPAAHHRFHKLQAQQCGLLDPGDMTGRLPHETCHRMWQCARNLRSCICCVDAIADHAMPAVVLAVQPLEIPVFST